MLADQILQPLHRFHFGNVEFHRRFADVKIHLRQRVARGNFGPAQKTPDAYPLMTTRQFEFTDARLPARGGRPLAGQRVVFVRVPERAVVTGVDVHRSVVSPARV